MDAQEVNGNGLQAYQPEWSGAATDKGPRRAENQDAFWIPDQGTPTNLGSLYLVADGVGGQQDGAAASKMAVEIVRQVYYDLRRQGEPISDSLKQALERANQTILDDAQKREIRKMGSTFVAAAINGDELNVAHVGDARAYLIRQGELRQLTRDDTWVQRQVEAGLITEEEAARHEFRNVVTQVLGNKPEINVNLSKTHTLRPGDVILLCSDGLYDALPDRRMISLATENAPQSAARLLIEAAIEAEATDNITAVVLRTDQFVPLADEPTLLPIPVAIESAPTIIASPISTPTQPLPKDKGGIPKWLIILAIIAIILIAGALVTFWFQNRDVAEDSRDAAATALPATANSPMATSTNFLESLNPPSTEDLPTETSEPEATATIQPLDTPTSRPSPSPTIQAASEPRGCVSGKMRSYVWDDAKFNADCSPTSMELGVGHEVRILPDQPAAPGGNCGPGQFLKIQSVNDAALEGWVHEGGIDLIATGESCSP